jgi:hypothetical protein
MTYLLQEMLDTRNVDVEVQDAREIERSHARQEPKVFTPNPKEVHFSED